MEQIQIFFVSWHPKYKVDWMSTGYVRLSEDTYLPLTGEASAMMPPEINTTPSHDRTGSTESTNPKAGICDHAH